MKLNGKTMVAVLMILGSLATAGCSGAAALPLTGERAAVALILGPGHLEAPGGIEAAHRALSGCDPFRSGCRGPGVPQDSAAALGQEGRRYTGPLLRRCYARL